MSPRLIALAFFASILIFITVIQLIRNQRLSEEYSSMWLIVSSLVLLSTLMSEKILSAYSWFKGQDGSGSEILLFFSMTFLVFLLMYMSIKLSDYRKNIVRLSQQIALIKNKVSTKEKI